MGAKETRSEYVWQALKVTAMLISFHRLGGVQIPISDNLRAVQEAISTTTTMWVVFLTLLALAVQKWRHLVSDLKKVNMLWVLLLLAAVSVFWSIDPSTTMKRFELTFLATGFGFFFSFLFRPKEQLKLLGLFFLGVSVASLLFVVFVPDEGIMTGFHEGRWKGICWHKNGLGMVAAHGIIVFLFLNPYKTLSRALPPRNRVFCLHTACVPINDQHPVNRRKHHHVPLPCGLEKGSGTPSHQVRGPSGPVLLRTDLRCDLLS